MPGIRNHNAKEPFERSVGLDNLVSACEDVGLRVCGGAIPPEPTDAPVTMAQLVFKQEDVFVVVCDGKVSINWKREK